MENDQLKKSVELSEENNKRDESTTDISFCKNMKRLKIKHSTFKKEYFLFKICNQILSKFCIKRIKY